MIALGANDAYWVGQKATNLSALKSNIDSMMGWIGSTRRVQWILPYYPNVPNSSISSRTSYDAMKSLTSVLEVRAALQEASQKYSNLYVTDDFVYWLPFMTGQLLSNHLISDGVHMDTFAGGWFAHFLSTWAQYTASTCVATKESISVAADTANIVGNQ